MADEAARSSRSQGDSAGRPRAESSAEAAVGVDRRELLAASAVAALAGLVPGSAGAASPRPDGLAFAGAAEVAAALRGGEVSSVELVDLLLARIERHNPTLNAIVALGAERARERASEADRARARGEEWGPLHGVPMTIKETFEMAGVRTTAGAPFLAQHVPERDAVVVERARRSGAVLLGKTNVPLMASDWQSYNEIYGRTNNPWDLERTPGGSTGGGAAAVAAGLSYLSVGSDIGGSIRIPAGFCGLYGHKPTLGLVPLQGHIPPPPGTPPGVPLELPVAGPLARSAADLGLALEALGGPLEREAIAYRWALPAPRHASLREYRIRYVLDDPYCPVTAEVGRLLGDAIDALRDAGATVVEGWPEGVDPAAQLETYLYLLFQAMDPGLPEAVKDTIRAARDSGAAMASLRARALDDPYHESMRRRVEQEAARSVWARFFDTHDAFLSPVSFAPAFRHDPSQPFEARRIETAEGDRDYGDLMRWIAFATLTGCPATAAPVGLTAAGLPVAIQIMGPYLEDATPIDLAGRLGEAIGGFRSPPGFE
ncbi:MAG TPA: amidase [Thermoanaerobaculia bacterium]|nr:amidase [Thermoanaerobaculia bacterium]